MKSKFIKNILIIVHKVFIDIWVSFLFCKFGWKVYGIDNNSSKVDSLYNKIKNIFEKAIKWHD